MTGFATEASDEAGDAIGVLVVGAVELNAVQRRDLLALTGMMGRMNVSLLANLVKRLQEGDPAARRDLLRVLREHNFNVARSARSVGTTRATLYNYMRKLEIPIQRIPAGARAGDNECDLEQH